MENENLNPTLPFKILMSNIGTQRDFILFSSICTCCGLFSVYRLRQMLFLVVSRLSPKEWSVTIDEYKLLSFCFNNEV